MEWRGPYSHPAALDKPNENPRDIPITIIPARDNPTWSIAEIDITSTV